MSDPSSVTVAGAGVLGLSVAMAVQRRGAPVVLLDPSQGEANASSVAAGLLAPVGEALFDPPAAAHYELLAAALLMWRQFAEVAGIALSPVGMTAPAAYRPAAKALRARMAVAGDAILIEADRRVVDPSAALASMRRAFEARGGRFEKRSISNDDIAGVGVLILATGPGSVHLAETAPELRKLTPVKGQIAVLPHGPSAGPTVRWQGGYFAPQAGGARIGATMEEGVADTNVESVAIQELIRQARLHVPDLDTTGAYGQAGVRMQTPDALPLVGPSKTPGVLLAVGARRNGWLLGPLVGEMIAAYVVGEDPGPWAAMLHPGRFE